MSELIATCPCCKSQIRVVPGKPKLEVVSMTKPSADEVWHPSALPEPTTPRSLPRASGVHREAVRVIIRVGREHGFTFGELRSSSRRPALVEARRLAAVAARVETDASLPQIGRILNRDHSTILHHIRAVMA